MIDKKYIICIVIFVVILISVGFYMYKKKKKGKTEVPSLTPPEEASKDELIENYIKNVKSWIIQGRGQFKKPYPADKDIGLFYKALEELKNYFNVPVNNKGDANFKGHMKSYFENVDKYLKENVDEYSGNYRGTKQCRMVILIVFKSFFDAVKKGGNKIDRNKFIITVYKIMIYLDAMVTHGSGTIFGSITDGRHINDSRFNNFKDAIIKLVENSSGLNLLNPDGSKFNWKYYENNNLTGSKRDDNKIHKFILNFDK